MKKIAIGDRRFVITKNLIMMLVMLVVIFVAIFAWYSNNTEVTASGTTISAKAADKVELALPVKGENGYEFPVADSEWKTELNFKLSEYFKNLVKDITSNGEQFAIPNFETGSIKDGRRVIVDDVWEQGLSSKAALQNDSTLDDDQYNYISFDFYVRSKVKDIRINADSFLAAGCELGYEDADHPDLHGVKPLKGSSIYRHSTYGAAEGNSEAFSSDAIVGAMRVSLVGAPVQSVSTANNTVTETLLGDQNLDFLWLPRPDIHLNTTENQNTWTLSTGLTPAHSSFDNNTDDTYCHSFYYGEKVGEQDNEINKTLTKTTYWDTEVKHPEDYTTKPSFFYVSKVTDNTVFIDSQTNNYIYPTLGQSPLISQDATDDSLNIAFTVENSEPKTGYYVYKYTLNLWIEGEDAEARRSMNDGIFSLKLFFGN